MLWAEAEPLDRVVQGHLVTRQRAGLAQRLCRRMGHLRETLRHPSCCRCSEVTVDGACAHNIMVVAGGFVRTDAALRLHAEAFLSCLLDIIEACSISSWSPCCSRKRFRGEWILGKSQSSTEVTAALVSTRSVALSLVRYTSALHAALRAIRHHAVNPMKVDSDTVPCQRGHLRGFDRQPVDRHRHGRTGCRCRVRRWLKGRCKPRIQRQVYVGSVHRSILPVRYHGECFTVELNGFSSPTV